MRTIFNSKKGFTLIELLIVIAVIGILVGFAVVNLIGVRQRARDGDRKADLKVIQSAIELYRADQNSYPLSLPACNGSITGPGGSPIYLQALPCESLPSWPVYTYAPSGSPPQTYTMTACLENTNDPDVAGTAACGSGRVYTVRNP